MNESRKKRPTEIWPKRTPIIAFFFWPPLPLFYTLVSDVSLLFSSSAMFVRLLYSELKSGKNAKELFPSKAIFLNGPLQVKVVEWRKKFKKSVDFRFYNHWHTHNIILICWTIFPFYSPQKCPIWLFPKLRWWDWGVFKKYTSKFSRA